MNRIAAVLAVVGLIAGILAGYVVWGGPSRQLTTELTDVRGHLDEESRRASQLEARLAAAETELERLKGELEAERELRVGYEQAMSRGRK
jgi:uncharacterized protein HemX